MLCLPDGSFLDQGQVVVVDAVVFEHFVWELDCR